MSENDVLEHLILNYEIEHYYVKPIGLVSDSFQLIEVKPTSTCDVKKRHLRKGSCWQMVHLWCIAWKLSPPS